MPDIAIIPSGVLASASGSKITGTAGVAITAGQVVYVDTSDSGKIKLADSDAATPAFNVAGIALHAASPGQPLTYVTTDPSFTIGATVAIGDAIYLSDTPGGMTKTFSELESGDKITILGVAVTTGTMNLYPVQGGTI